MTNKFKVGDKARITGNTNSHRFYIGEVVILKEVDNNTWTCCHLDRRDFWYVRESDMEPYEEPLTLQEKFEQGWSMVHNDGTKVVEIHTFDSGNVAVVWEDKKSNVFSTEQDFMNYHTITPPAPKVQRRFTGMRCEPNGGEICFYSSKDCETLEEAKEAVKIYNRDDVYPTCILEHEKQGDKWVFVKAHEV